MIALLPIPVRTILPLHSLSVSIISQKLESIMLERSKIDLDSS